MLLSDRLRSKKDSVSINTLLLKEAKGMTKKDKLVLFSLKNLYLASRAVSRIILGKKNEIVYTLKEELVFRVFCINISNFWEWII